MRLLSRGEKRPGAVIEAKAKKYKGDEGMEAGPQYTAAQVGVTYPGRYALVCRWQQAFC